MRRAKLVDLSDDGKFIDVWFKYDASVKAEVEVIPGARFVGKGIKGGRWRVPRDLQTCKQLRVIFGPTKYKDGFLISGMFIGDRLKAWARKEQQLQRNLHSLAQSTDADLVHITSDSRIGRAIAGEPIKELSLPKLPTGKPHPLMTKRPARPYQRADIAMMAQANVGNFNQPGTGKTIETIGSWVESECITEGPQLVLAPVSSLELVWAEEIHMWLPEVIVYTDKTAPGRKMAVEQFLHWHKDNPMAGTVVALNFDWVRLEKYHHFSKPGYDKWDAKRVKAEAKQRGIFTKNASADQLREKLYTTKDRKLHACSDHKGNWYRFKSKLQQMLFQVEWASCTVDEFHKAGLNNRNTLFTIGIELLKVARRAVLSGTPMGGRPRKLWPCFHWLEPDKFSAEWIWITRFLQVDDEGRGKKVGDIKEGHEDEFYDAHKHIIIRRLKKEVLPGIPDRVEQVVWCDMTPQQRKQYDRFAEDLEIMIDEQRLSAANVLTEYQRLKQFANAKQRMEDGVPYPTADSGKLAALLEHLDENGIRKHDPEPGARAIVGSESSRMVYMVVDWLNSHGIAAEPLTGDRKIDRDAVVHWFKDQSREARVIVCTVQTGGVSLNLEEAGSMHALDETWNPDDLEQFFERGDRGGRTEPLRCYIYRTKGTIQEYIAEVNEGKAVTNANVLDLRRQMYGYEEAA